MSKVSILMNGYNAELYLKESINSIFAQTYNNWEIIFVDNCSTDGTKRIVDKYKDKIKYYKTYKNIPLGEARNFGLKYCSGEYIAFLDCDDIYLPKKLEQQVKLMKSKDFAMCYGSFVVIDENGKEIKKDIVKNNSGNVFSGLLKRYEINMQTVMLKKDFVISNGLSFNVNMLYCPDHNLFMNIAAKAEVGIISDIVAKYRIVSNSLSKKTLHIAPQEFRFTLDEISKNDPMLRQKLSDDFDYAYSKAKYYEVISYIHSNDRKEARSKLRSIFTTKIEYFLLYLLLLLPIKNKFILKLLGR